MQKRWSEDLPKAASHRAAMSLAASALPIAIAKKASTASAMLAFLRGKGRPVPAASPGEAGAALADYWGKACRMRSRKRAAAGEKTRSFFQTTLSSASSKGSSSRKHRGLSEEVSIRRPMVRA